MNVKQNTASGISSAISENNSMASVMAAHRFYNNESVDIPSLNDPIIKDAVIEVNKRCNEYVLLMNDWSILDFKNHTSKKELIKIKNKNNSQTICYDLQTTLAVSDVTGQPIAPLVQNLKTNKHIYSTYNDNIDINLTHMDELSQRIKYISNNLDLNKKTVSIIDREGDVVDYYRKNQKNEQLFLQRIKSNTNLYSIEQKKLIKTDDLAKSLEFKEIEKIKYNKKIATLFVAETPIEVRRDSSKTINNEDGTKTVIKVSGEPVELRFIVTKLVDEQNKTIATWKLLSNVFDENVDEKTLAKWYYYRWKIESYFKLLKTSGFQLESWQQREPKAIFRRLLVVSYACLLVWKIADDTSEEAHKIKLFLMKLSGTVTLKKNTITNPALLRGLWNFLSIMEVISIYDLDKLFKMKSSLDKIMGMKC
jgi:hypothetical protein